MPRKCGFENCERRPIYGFEGRTNGNLIFCGQHKADKMVDVVSRRCQHEGCLKRPIYGAEGERPQYCSNHKQGDMVDVKSRRCEFEACTRVPSYGMEAGKPKRCYAHKEDDMQNVVSQRCQYPECLTRASYGLEGDRPKYCATHKGDGMLDVSSRRCRYPNCTRQPSYGIEGTRPSFCSQHKADGMVDVKNRRCECTGCTRVSIFGQVGDKPRWCAVHRLDGTTDVRMPKCDISRCGRLPSWGTAGQKPNRCDQHKGPDMVDLKNAANIPVGPSISDMFTMGLGVGTEDATRAFRALGWTPAQAASMLLASGGSYSPYNLLRFNTLGLPGGFGMNPYGTPMGAGLAGTGVGPMGQEAAGGVAAMANHDGSAGAMAPPTADTTATPAAESTLGPQAPDPTTSTIAAADAMAGSVTGPPVSGPMDLAQLPGLGAGEGQSDGGGDQPGISTGTAGHGPEPQHVQLEPAGMAGVGAAESTGRPGARTRANSRATTNGSVFRDAAIVSGVATPPPDPVMASVLDTGAAMSRPVYTAIL